MKHADYAHKEYTVLDFETTINNRGEDAIGKSEGSPHHPDNSIVWWGNTRPHFPFAEFSKPSTWSEDQFQLHQNGANLFKAMESCDVIVGHNIKFDLLHLMYAGYKDFLIEWLEKGGVIWDTMLGEYLLDGQSTQFASLDSICQFYGGTLKDDRIKNYWDAGVCTTEIPDVEIKPYLKGDLLNTALIYEGQLTIIEDMFIHSDPASQVHRENFLALCTTQMAALVATTFIEYNGIHFDVPSAADVASDLAVVHGQVEEELQQEMADTFNYLFQPVNRIKAEECKPGSAVQISSMLFGGEFKYHRKTPLQDENNVPVRYKTGPNKGKIKYHNKEIILNSAGLLPEYRDIMKPNNNGYSVDDSSLKRLIKKCTRKMPLKFLTKLQQYRSLEKELSVSYMGLLKLVWPTDSCIHGNFNHCATNTGRLSSSAPNQQNFSGKEVKS